MKRKHYYCDRRINPANPTEMHLREAVEVFAEDGRCVLGLADQVPPDGLISRVRRVREAVEAAPVRWNR